ncbi:LacI family DNA-binding transcriptional regulator [Zhouia sp. PK063]|uniref:LacI family DNA-binding transcriptional regulator n=1 Tax=Zhouia sp. PK063 TaxID=3373602 RepID=UPI0037A1F3FD
MRQKITLKEISKKLNVSISTVSKALRDSPEISEKTKEIVKAFAKENHYRPNNIALSLKNRKTKNIGIIIPEIVHHFFSSIINGVQQTAAENGYNVIICMSDESHKKEEANMLMLANGSIDGFILSLSQETQKLQKFDHIKEVIEQGMPVVMVDRVTDEVQCDKVINDDLNGAYNAVKYLIDQGKKKIALVATADYFSVGRLRAQGYFNALSDAGITVDEELIVKVKDLNDGRPEIEELLNNHDIDAVFAITEFLAVSAMRVAEQRGMNIPNDFAAIGFTNGIISRIANPTLTTVSQHGYEIGKEATELLIHRLENEEKEIPYKTQVVKTTLIKRESTKN